MGNRAHRSHQFWFGRNHHLGLQYFHGAAPTRYPHHRQSEYVAVFCLQGEVEVAEGSQLLTLRAGEMLIGNPGRWRSSIYGVDGGECEGVTLIASPEALAGQLARQGMPCPPGGQWSLLGKLTPRDLIPVARLAAAAMRPGAAESAELALEGASRLLLAETLGQWPRELIRAASEAEGEFLPRPEFVRAVSWMHGIRIFDFSLERLCAELGCEPAWFAERFHQSTGLAPEAQFERLVAARAADLLGRHPGREREVAEEVGFRSVAEMRGRLGELSVLLSDNIHHKSLSDF